MDTKELGTTEATKTSTIKSNTTEATKAAKVPEATKVPEAAKVPEATKAPEITKTEGNAAQTTAEATSAPGADNTGDAKTAEATATNKITTGIAAPATDKPGEDNGNTPPAPATDALAPDYLSGGYHKGEGKARYIGPDLLDKTAQQVARALAQSGLKQSSFNPILRELKRGDKRSLPLEAKRGALSGAIVAAKLLEQRHRAPGLLCELLERNRAAVQTDEDYKAAVKHLTAVGVFLGDYQE